MECSAERNSFIHALGSGGRGRGAGALRTVEGTHLHDQPTAPCFYRGRERGQGSHKLGELPFSAVLHRSGILSMTPLDFPFPHPHPPRLLFGVVVQPTEVPLALASFLSPSDSLRQLFPSPARTRTHSRHAPLSAQPRARTLRARRFT